jgi:GntR family transcriptional regulator
MHHKIQVNFHSKEPLYYQIEEQIKCLIVSGDIGSGEQLPTVRELAEDLDINFNTIARVYRRLDQQGYVSSQQGRGCYVLDRQVPIEEDRRKVFEQLTESYLRQCEALHIPKEEVRKHFLRILATID